MQLTDGNLLWQSPCWRHGNVSDVASIASQGVATTCESSAHWYIVPHIRSVASHDIGGWRVCTLYLRHGLRSFGGTISFGFSSNDVWVAFGWFEYHRGKDTSLEMHMSRVICVERATKPCYWLGGGDRSCISRETMSEGIVLLGYGSSLSQQSGWLEKIALLLRPFGMMFCMRSRWITCRSLFCFLDWEC